LILTGSTTAGSTTIGTLNVEGNTTLGDAGTDTITLHGVTTLDNTFTVSGANLTSLGGNFTVTGTAWTATPTISGLITATSGLTSTGTLTSNGTLTANGIVTLGDNGDNVTIDSNVWDITGAGVASGLTGLASTGTIAFSGAGTFSIDSSAFDVSTAGALSGITTIATSSTINSQTISATANFTGSLTVAGALAADGGITFNASTDTVGAHTLSGTLDANTNIITNIGNAETDFIATTGALNLAGALTIAANANVVMTSGTGTFAQTYTGTTTTANTITANSLTTGTGLDVNTTNTATTNTALSAISFDIINAQSTLANTAGITGLAVNFTNNPTIAGNTGYAVRIQNQLTANITDNAVAALLLLDNADTVAGGTTIVTDAIKITNSGGANFTNFLETPTIDISAAGALSGITTLNMSGQLTSTLAIGTAPFAVTSTTVNTNLNADLLDGQHGAYYAAALSGTINEIAYFNSATSISSLAVATYPSLTELSYVKGVTSAIQTQLGGKQATISFGTGVLTALGVNVGTAGSPLVNGGVLGTPSSGTVTNLTGTASININGTVGATTATTGKFTTLEPTGLTTGYVPYKSATVLANSPIYTDGTNVGIGTVVPSGILSVTPTQYSTGTASQALTTVTGVGTTFTSAMVGSQFVFANGTSAGTITAFGSITSLTVSTSQTVTSQAYNIAYTGLQVTTTGNVGIGTTGPNTPLQLLKDMNCNGNSLEEACMGISVLSAANQTKLALGASSAGNFSYVQSMQDQTSWTNRALVLQPRGGNVGIGTTGPLSKLYAIADDEAAGIQILHSNLTQGVNIGWSGIRKIGSGTNIDMQIDAKGTGNLWLQTNSTGNVGIGTTNPGGKLDVGGAYADANIKFTAGILGAKGSFLGIPTYQLNIEDSTAMAAGVGGAIVFSGKFTGTGSYAALGSIQGVKSNATDGNYAGELQFYTRVHGGSNTQKMVIDSTGNVGIGTTNPTSLMSFGKVLEISGGTGNSALALSGNSLAGQGTIGYNNSILYIDAVGAATGANNTIRFSTTDVNSSTTRLPRMTILSSGNVGIGTTGPGQKLSVVSTDFTGFGISASTGINGISQALSNTSGNLYLAIDSSTGGNLGIGNYTRAIWSSGAYPFAIAVNGAERMRIDSSGNVGIGTTGPNTKLHVVGTESDTVGPATSMIGIGSYGDGANPLWGLRIDSTLGEDLYLDRRSGAVNYNVMTWERSTGNVGIGTVAPSGILSVTPTQYSTGTASQALTTVTGVGTTFTSAMVGSQFVFANGTTAGTITAFGSITSLTVSTSQTVTSQAYNIAYTGLQVATTGNVGIGITNPNQTLDVNGTIQARSAVVNLSNYLTASATSAMINFFTDAQGMYKNWNIATNGTVAGAFTITPSSGVGGNVFTTPFVTILQAGNVGIGTTAPGMKLEIGAVPNGIATSGSTAIGGLRLHAAAPDYNTVLDMGVSASGQDGWIQATDAGTLSTGNKLLLNPNGGNVGIGTVGPYTKLTLDGPQATIYGISLGNQGGVGWPSVSRYIGIGNTDGNIGLNSGFSGIEFGGPLSASEGYLAFHTHDNGVESGERMRINKSGNVGIGTTGPNYKLHVKGVTPLIFVEPTVGTDYAGYRLTNSGNDSFLIGDASVGGTVFSGSLAYSTLLGSFSNTPLQFATNTTVKMTILSGGNVGIGETSPGALLHLAKSGGDVDLKFTDVGIGAMILGTKDGSGNFEIASGNTLGTNTRFLVQMTSGNVGIGTTNPVELLSLGTTGTTAGVLSLAGVTTGKVIIAVAAAAGSWTMTLPTTIGTAGYQLTTAASDGVTSWAAAGSSRQLKDILGTVTDPSEALTQILQTPIYRFHYKTGMGTGDSKTEYVGVMADESPWAMHYGGTIINPVNTLGYMVLGIQATNKKIEEMNLKVEDLSSLDTTSATSLGSLIKNFLADIGNGLEKIFVREVNTDTLCVSDATGAKTCINKAQLDDLLASTGGSSGSSSPLGGGAGGGEPTCSDGIMNQDETGIDTGGVCEVPPTEPICTDTQTLVDGVCTDMVQVLEAPTCTDTQTLVNGVCTDPAPVVEPIAEPAPEPAPAS
ncbi:MAG: hypothetical protein WC908_01960, partial [Candidatus Paceibacterota bacterium]